MSIWYEQDFDVLHFECDINDRMTPSAMLRRAQEVSGRQCVSLGIDDAFYERSHSVFLLSKVSLKISNMPYSQQHVRIKTRAYGIKRAVYYRMTVLQDERGETLCEMDSRWVLVDTQTKRIMRTAPSEISQHFFGEPVGETHSFDIPKPGALFNLQQLRAGYSVCDRIGHVNNSNYADFVCDHLPFERLQSALPQRMVFLYRSEIVANSSFSLLGSCISEGGYYFLGEQNDIKNFEAYAEF